jgi:2-keto-3-deoxy-6-phosphogluconate aldolase
MIPSKEAVIVRIKESGLVAIVRAENGEQALKITEACIAGGVAAIEITFTVPRAHEIIKELASRYRSGEIILGAGTVLDPETASRYFGRRPVYHKPVFEWGNRQAVQPLPGGLHARRDDHQGGG